MVSGDLFWPTMRSLERRQGVRAPGCYCSKARSIWRMGTMVRYSAGTHSAGVCGRRQGSSL